MIRFKNITAMLLSGVLVLSLASCSIGEPDVTNKVVNPSVSVGLSEEARKPTSRLIENAVVNYDDYKLSESDDLKTMEKKIETKYGVDIVFGDEVRTEFGDESEQIVAEKYTNEANIKTALMTLDNILNVYPKTFFYQLRLTEDSPVKIYMTGHIKSLTYPDANINACTSDTDSKGEFYLLIDIAGIDGTFNPIDIMHEIVHLTDFKLKSKGFLKSEEWAKLNPEGFTYTERSDRKSEDKYNFGTKSSPMYTSARTFRRRWNSGLHRSRSALTPLTGTSPPGKTATQSLSDQASFAFSKTTSPHSVG